MGNVVDFNKGKEKVLHRKKIQEIEKQKKGNGKVRKHLRRKNRAFSMKVIGFYALLFMAIFVTEAMTNYLIK